jgi:hypothetical protein
MIFLFLIFFVYKRDRDKLDEYYKLNSDDVKKNNDEIIEQDLFN